MVRFFLYIYNSSRKIIATTSGSSLSNKRALQSENSGLPEGWEVRHSNSKNLPYYFNASTKESRWEPPSGTDSNKLKTDIAISESDCSSARKKGDL